MSRGTRPWLLATDPRRWGACWTDGEIAEMFAGRARVGIAEALDPETGLGEADRVWLGCRYLAEHDRPALIRFADRCAAAARYAAAAYADAASDGAAAAYAAAAAADAASDAADAARAAAELHAAARAERGAQCAWLLAEVTEGIRLNPRS